MTTQLIRRNVYEKTHKKVLEWAEQLYNKYDVRSPNNKPLHKNFSYALDLFIKTTTSHNINEVFK